MSPPALPQSDVEPAYLIYLHFYAAISMEMCSRSLYASQHRSTLLQQAEMHYTHTADLIQSESLSPQRLSRSSITSSNGGPPSIYSPVSSVGSRASTASTGLSSPTPSLCGTEDRLPSALRSSTFSSSPVTSAPKKRVTFSESPPDVPEQGEPFIRPDSPTLGFDDWAAPLQRETTKPAPMLPLALHGSQFSEEDEEDDHDPDSAHEPLDHDPNRRSFSTLFFPQTSNTRYASLLAALLDQVNAHRTSVRAELAQPTCENSVHLSSGRCTPESPAFFRGCASPCLSEEGGDGAALLRARIDKLRQSGWRRRRFDPGRYEALRESALAELE
jgi:hypothetical protein